MRPRPTVTALALTLPLLATLTGCQKPMAAAEPTPAQRTITISGEGFVNAKPDLAIVMVGVVTQGATAAEALAENSKHMNALFSLIQGLGIDAKDVQTSNLQVQPRFAPADPSKPGSDNVIAGYDATNEVTVRLRDLAKLGDALDRFISVAGANNLRGLSFDFSNPDPLVDQARKNAVADATRKAKLYAGAAGVTLGAVQSISESESYRPLDKVGGFARAMAAPVPVAAGESRLSAEVTITYALQ